MKQSIVIKEVDTIEVLKKSFNSQKDAILFCKKLKSEMAPEEKIKTKFKIKNHE